MDQPYTVRLDDQAYAYTVENIRVWMESSHIALVYSGVSYADTPGSLQQMWMDIAPSCSVSMVVENTTDNDVKLLDQTSNIILVRGHINPFVVAKKSRAILTMYMSANNHVLVSMQIGGTTEQRIVSPRKFKLGSGVCVSCTGVFAMLDIPSTVTVNALVVTYKTMPMAGKYYYDDHMNQRLVGRSPGIRLDVDFRDKIFRCGGEISTRGVDDWRQLMGVVPIPHIVSPMFSDTYSDADSRKHLYLLRRARYFNNHGIDMNDVKAMHEFHKSVTETGLDPRGDDTGLVPLDAKKRREAIAAMVAKPTAEKAKPATQTFVHRSVHGFITSTVPA